MIRKQFLLSPAAAERVARMAANRGTSASEIVRQAIDAFDGDVADTGDAPELTDLVSARLKEAIQATRKANRAVNCSMSQLSKGVA